MCFSEHGNPGGVGAFYSGTVQDKDGQDPVILRPEIDTALDLLRTVKEKKIFDSE